MYEYIKNTYNQNPIPGRRVKHTVTDRYGTIKRESRSNSHYVMVNFDGDNFNHQCHPDELNYDPKEEGTL